MSSERASLVLLTKAPGAGAKSRLRAEVGEDFADRLARAFLVDSIALCRESGLPVTVALTPASARAEMERLAGGLRLANQCDGDLGDRIRHALDLAAPASGHAVLIGSDSPDLPPGHIAEAVRLLAANDLVLGPAADGGFYLIAARRALPAAIFDGVSWSTDGVFERVAGNARALGLRLASTGPWSDVDDAPSLAALFARIEGTQSCPATRSVLAAHGRTLEVSHAR